MCLFVCSPTVVALDAPPPIVAAQGTLQAAFAPWDDVEGLIVTALRGAQQDILVQAYLLTNKPVVRALIAARQRGVQVQVLVDAEQALDDKYSGITALVNADIPVWLETQYQHAHNKLMIIDAASAASVVITGSFNFTWTAQHKNAENILIARNNRPLATRYATNWERHRQDATAYKK